MAESSRPGSADPDAGRRRQQSAMGHSFRKVTLTRPSFCHGCSDFIWGLIGFLCEVCNFMCHEKCLKTLRTVCTCMAPSQVQVPVAHCFGPAGQKKRFCCVCRKQTEGSSALRCEVCELHVHADCAAFSCADCRCCHLDQNLQQESLQHQWREGDPASARCEFCRRSCGSSEVLSGSRCEWCGVTSHASCRHRLPAQCDLGRLRSMMLPPPCVRLQSRNFSKMQCYRIGESGGPDRDNWDEAEPAAAAPRELQSAAPETSKQVIKVFDGDDALRRGSFRLAPGCRGVKDEEVEAALRAFYLPGEPHRFDLEGVGAAQRHHGDALVLRAKPRRDDVIKVHAAWSRSSAASAEVSETSTAASILSDVLLQLDGQGEDASSFSLQEVYMSSKQVQRQTLSPQDNMMDKLQEIRKLSLRQMNQTRFYVVRNQNPAVQVGLLISGLPPLLTKEEYCSLLQEQLDFKGHLVTLTHFYEAQGAVALQISCFAEAERIYMLAKDTTVSNKTLTSLIIPEIQCQRLGGAVCPLLVFVNPRSGGLKGGELLHSFRKLLNPHQVFDLTNGGPLAGLHAFREVPRFRVLVCGGDGTVGWVLGVLETARHRLLCRQPPVGIVPLGTGEPGGPSAVLAPSDARFLRSDWSGNDLARVLRWGPGYGGDDPQHILASVDEADEVQMDRWTILLDAQDVSEDGKDSGDLEPPKIVQMNNYFGLGIDAELSLDFHLAREGEPDKFTSRFHNKGVYVKVGLQKISRSRSLHKELQLQVDKQPVPLPNIEGLIFLNIPSWGSGADLWGSEADGRFSRPRMDDGLLEVVGVTGVVHMGQVQSGLRSGIRIAQGSYIRLVVSKELPVQVDGEPWLQAPGHVIISAAGPKVQMLRKSKLKQRKSPSSRDGGH